MTQPVWDAGAHNVNIGNPAQGSLRVSGTIPQGVTGAVIGLTAESQVTRPAQILHGIQVSAGRYRVVELGDAKTGWYGTPDALARYHVTRLTDRVIYSVESEEGGETDAATSGDIVPGTIFHEADFIGPAVVEGAASLLSPGDSIINGEVLNLNIAGIEISFEPMEVVAATGTSAKVTFEPMLLQSGVHRSGEATVAFQPLEVDALLTQEGVAFATVQFEPMQVSASMAGELSVGDGAVMVMEPMDMLASGYPWFEPTATVEFEPPAVGAYLEEYTGVYASMEPMLVYSSGQRVPTGARFSIILPAITHEVFLGTKVVEYGFAFNEGEYVTARNLIDTVLVSDEFIVFRSDRWTETGKASDALQHSTVAQVESAADALDAYSHKSLQPGVTELATADNAIAHYSDVTLTLTSTATASDTTISTGYAVVTEDAQASIELQAVTAQTVETEAQAESAVEMIQLDDGTLVEATAFGFTDLEHWRQSVMLVGEFAEVFSDYLHQDPNAIAWVLNPETAALSNYTNHPITGIAGAFMIGPEGLMRIDNDSDNGDDISALIDLPGLTLGRPDRQGQISRSPERKRVEAVWLDADSQTEMAVGVRSYDQGGEPFHYKSLRPLDDTGNMKVSVGKGLKSKWWGVTIRNTYGGDFTLSGASADVAATARWR